jgi:membrane protease subunit (stomatin/prohibitin family)
MGILDKLKGELIDIVEWIEEDDSAIAYRFDRYGNEIKNGAQLTVREGQIAVFVNEGELADIFKPGMYELTTENLPVLSTLKGWVYGFKSPFKAEVYFISTRVITGFGWGTPNPFRLRDPEFGILEITSRGVFSIHVVDSAKFIRKVVGTDGEFTKSEIKVRMRKKFVTEAISAIAESGKSFYDIAAHFDDLSIEVKDRVGPFFLETYGISLDEVSIQSVDLSQRSAEKVEQRDEIMFNDNRMNMYERQARADALKGLASNPSGGGMAGNLMGLGVGMTMANQMAQSMNPMGGAPAAAPQAAAPPPPPVIAFFVYAGGQQAGPLNMQQLMQMAQQGGLSAQTQVWKQGMAAWTPAGNVPELAGLFAPPVAPPPPPIPPQGTDG